MPYAIQFMYVLCKLQIKKREKNLQKIKTEKSKLENLEVSVSRDFLDYDSLKIGICYVLSSPPRKRNCSTSFTQISKRK